MNNTPNTAAQQPGESQHSCASTDALNVLRQILCEVLPGHRPHSTDSYLPAHLVEAAQACVAAAEADPDPLLIMGAYGWNATTGRRFDIARRPAGGLRLILLQDGEEEGGAIFEPGEHADALLLGSTWVAERARLAPDRLECQPITAAPSGFAPALDTLCQQDAFLQCRSQDAQAMPDVWAALHVVCAAAPAIRALLSSVDGGAA